MGCRCVGRPVRMFTYSPIPLTRAAWWKYPAVIAFLEILFGRVSNPSKTADIPQNVKVCSRGYNLHFLELHDIFKLRANFPSLPEKLRMQEMSGSPIVPEAVRPLVNEHNDVRSHTHPWLFHWLKTFRRVKWSLSGTLNFSRAASASSIRSFGR